MERLSLLDARVGEEREGSCRVWNVRQPSTDSAYVIVELGHELGCSTWAWLGAGEQQMVEGVEYGDEVWVRVRITDVWTSGAFDVDLLDIGVGESGEEEDAIIDALLDGSDIHLDLTPESAGYLLRVLARDLEHGVRELPETQQVELWSMALFLHDILPASLRTAVPPRRHLRKRARAA
jgi:hypothetical protein